MPKLNETQVNALIESVNQKRKEYIDSSDYLRNMCYVFLQSLNLVSNNILAQTQRVVNEEVEFMAIYQQLIDICPEEFEGRNKEEIKHSIQKSIYGSVHSELFNNYICELKNNNSNSFLIVPISYYVPAEGFFGQRTTHGITLIMKKEEDKIKVTAYDRAQQHPQPPKRKVPNDKLSRTIWEKKSIGKISPSYTYEIEPNDKNIASIVEAIRVGRYHVSWWEKINPFSSYTKKLFTYHTTESVCLRRILY